MKLPERWYMELTPGGVRKIDLVQYYKRPDIAKNLLEFAYGNPIMVKAFFQANKEVLIRHNPDGSAYLTLQYFDPKEITDRTNLNWWVERRGVEFHYTIPEDGKTKLGWVDIDPKMPTLSESIATAKQIVAELYRFMRKKWPQYKYNIVYSGGRGFYLLFKLPTEMDANDLRNRLKVLLQEYIQQSKFKNILTLRPPKQGQVRLDISTLKPMGNIRIPYSINAVTGHIAEPVGYNRLKTFRPKHVRELVDTSIEPVRR